jgi:hypothetical protein
MRYLELFEHFQDPNPPIEYVYALDDYGNVDKKRVVGTHQYGKGFTPSDLGRSMGLDEHPTSIPDGTGIDNGDGDIFYSEDGGDSDDV